MNSETRDVELRGNIPKDLLQLIDALMQAGGHSNRMDVVIPVLWDFANRKVHEATLLLRMARVNPFGPESIVGDPAPPRLGGEELRNRGPL